MLKDFFGPGLLLIFLCKLPEVKIHQGQAGGHSDSIGNMQSLYITKYMETINGTK